MYFGHLRIMNNVENFVDMFCAVVHVRDSSSEYSKLLNTSRAIFIDICLM